MFSFSLQIAEIVMQHNLKGVFVDVSWTMHITAISTNIVGSKYKAIRPQDSVDFFMNKVIKISYASSV